MGLIEFLRQWPRGRLVAGALASLLIHLGLVAAVLLVKPSRGPVFVAKKGDALIVELPRPEEPAAAGQPGPTTPPPARRPAATPPVPKSPAPRAVAKAEPAPPVAQPQPAPALAKAEPAPPVAKAEPVPPMPPSPPVAAKEPESGPPATAEPAPRSPEPARPSSETATAPGGEPTRSTGDPQVASVAPGATAPPAPDIRTALRRGGAGGHGQGRGGIEGEPVPLDTPDPRYSDYMEQVRRKIKSNWGFPCLRNPVTRECEPKESYLIVVFGIEKDGRVAFVDLLQSSGYRIYDDYAVNAILLSSPFPRVPDTISRKGFPITAKFSYLIDTSLTNLLR